MSLAQENELVRSSAEQSAAVAESASFSELSAQPATECGRACGSANVCFAAMSRGLQFVSSAQGCACRVRFPSIVFLPDALGYLAFSWMRSQVTTTDSFVRFGMSLRVCALSQQLLSGDLFSHVRFLSRPLAQIDVLAISCRHLSPATATCFCPLALPFRLAIPKAQT
eukprot:6202271-Pleurochrysis_carterae.AAC.2